MLTTNDCYLLRLILDLFTDGIEPDELEGFISEILDNEFDTRAEDGSLLSV